ncbi:hypothetical protein [Mesorhizobium sp. M1A.F.Ca.IN.020.04.1.1]|uniref:hypothetical protein n=1 Tax=Mesorhizobium sp. M1A.F.Ca.IN.020.04.1.1 TaxID=2496761 RepID=UPI000FCAC184|nr:hypothetical protein [Mesorhizobium sp. M1A.F.Ca.IN.020.04.1.1]RUW04049.1 hypothetical protein EOA49_00545 [Mesorhizobium sp. M1A.F.Ca.IN.020.04.1.1]RUW04112.1 hypothetical protein EOA49_00880 [Mesorhizobium sp. M1A.F.Ca.IN.020.04.1.1]
MAIKSLRPIGGSNKQKKAARGEALRFYREVVLSYDGDECLIWPFAKVNTGYGVIGVGRAVKLVSRLLCEEAHGAPPTPRHEAAHSCGRGGDACVTKRHLSWKTHSENDEDKIGHGTRTNGQRNGQAKLTEDLVREIRSLKGTLSLSKTAAKFSLSRSHIKDIHSRKTWAWLE